MDEDRLLMAVALRQAIALFEERDQLIMKLYFQLEHVEGYDGRWPPTYASVGEYVGNRLLGVPMTEGGVRYRVEMAIERIKTLI